MFAVVVVVFVAAVALLLLTMISHLLFVQPKTRKELQADGSCSHRGLAQTCNLGKRTRRYGSIIFLG